jgi:hypothetical protein
MRWAWWRPLATPPENVRAVFPDGRVVPVELVYEGWRGGVHEWHAVIDVALEPGAGLALDMLPGHTSVNLRVAIPAPP